MKRIKKFLKKILPLWILAIRRSCGGRNRNTDLFAANLLQEGLPMERYLQLASNLIFENGVRKSTHAGRNAPILEKLLNRKEIGFREKIRVLDIGASFGIDALGNLELLSRHFDVESYTLADLYTELWYDPGKGIIFDQDGRVVQVLLKDHFVSFNFEFKFRIERLYQFRNIRYTARIRNRFRDAKPDPGRMVLIPLVHPEILKNDTFRTERLDVFEPLLPGQYDLIICMNLLQPRYFSRQMVDLGNSNLTAALAPGGVLVTGMTDDYRVIHSPDKVPILAT